MYKLNRKNHFNRKLSKLLKRDPSLAKLVIKILTSLADNPREPTLGSHKVIAKYDGLSAFSITLTKDLRILWRYGEVLTSEGTSEEDPGQIQLLDLIDVGPHSGSNKVYQ